MQGNDLIVTQPGSALISYLRDLLRVPAREHAPESLSQPVDQPGGLAIHGTATRLPQPQYVNGDAPA